MEVEGSRKKENGGNFLKNLSFFVNLTHVKFSSKKLKKGIMTEDGQFF